MTDYINRCLAGAEFSEPQNTVNARQNTGEIQGSYLYCRERLAKAMEALDSQTGNAPLSTEADDLDAINRSGQIHAQRGEKCGLDDGVERTRVNRQQETDDKAGVDKRDPCC